MLSRSLVVVALTGACGFQHGAPRTGDANGSSSDDAGLDGMRPVDAMPDAFGFCYGSFKNFCFVTMPSGTYEITALTNFDTDVDANCSTIVAQVNGPSLCVVAAATISFTGDVRATGSRGLVFIATNTFSNTVNLDVGSFYLGAASWTGSGIATGASCGAPTGGAADDNGGGGGAGGTFGAAGGNGAQGRNNAGGAGGVAATAPAAPTILRGGCNGTSGGGVTGGAGGAGGGVLYVIAETSITNGGTIRSSGQGGPGGGILAGGGGGGAGGMIVLDSPSIMNNGAVTANGGGGGEGGGQNGAGEAGDSGLAAATRAAGGSTNVNGGDGGLGGATTTPTGGPGVTGTMSGGGGGGGGGSVGVIKALRGTLTGNVSPAAT